MVGVWLQATATAQPPSTPMIHHSLGVARHEIVTLSDQQAQDILAEMGRLLRELDKGYPDFKCQVSFSLDGTVGVFGNSEAHGTIVDKTDLRAVIDVYRDADVKVVAKIEWCKERKINPSFWGCSDGTTIVVIDQAINLAAVTWAHEFGHTRPGIGEMHRNDPGALMHKRLAGGNRRVNEDECREFQR